GWVEYAELLRDKKDPEGAEEVIAGLIEANRRSLPARRAAARHFLRTGSPDRAEEHMAFALEELKARDAETLLLAAQVSTALDRAEDARRRLEQGVKLHPAHLKLRLALAGVEARAARTGRALELLRPVLGKLPEDPDELWGLGSLLVD